MQSATQFVLQRRLAAALAAAPPRIAAANHQPNSEIKYARSCVLARPGAAM